MNLYRFIFQINSEDRIITEYRKLTGTTRAVSIFRFMSLIEKQPTYGVHFYEVKVILVHLKN